jgi:hypothetical protein
MRSTMALNHSSGKEGEVRCGVVQNKCYASPSDVTRYITHLTLYTSHLTPHTSQVTRHKSHVTSHTSHVTRHTSPDSSKVMMSAALIVQYM